MPPKLLIMTISLSPPICWTTNGCEFVPNCSSVPVNVSVIVGTTGVGAGGTAGSLHADVKTAKTAKTATIKKRMVFSIIPAYCTVSVSGTVCVRVPAVPTMLTV